jgi:hypothetical protein
VDKCEINTIRRDLGYMRKIDLFILRISFWGKLIMIHSIFRSCMSLVVYMRGKTNRMDIKFNIRRHTL